MTQKQSPSQCLEKSDILDVDACITLVGYAEENDLVDYKASFDPSIGKSWIDLAVDLVAFANTNGGYVVFGVKNVTWEQLGVPNDICEILTDTKKVLEQVNRCLAPAITGARCRAVVVDGRRFVVVGVPASLNHTHIFESNRDWTPPGRGAITLVPKGSIFVRRSASNQVMTSVDFEELIERRIRRFREKILQGMARVVNADPSAEVLTVVRPNEAVGETGFLVTGAPDAFDLSGQRIQIKSDVIVSVVEMLRSISSTRPELAVDIKILYTAYAQRDIAKFRSEHIEWLALHSLIEGAPAFFWLSKMNREKARKLLLGAFEGSKPRRGHIVSYTGFYSVSLHSKLRERMPIHTRPNVYVNRQRLLNVGATDNPARDSQIATQLAQALSERHAIQDQIKLEKLDCALYAPF
jgi:hypothetical protein